MILYFDASALVKRYVAEKGSVDVARLLAQADIVGTSLISRAELSAALAKAARIKLLSGKEAAEALQVFRAEWGDWIRILLTETIVAQADALSWEHSLRGYDAVHLATALFWQETLGEPLTLVTYDRQLWEAARKSKLRVFPVQ
jgi:predicted nucleic acid-binding protein